MQVSAVEARLGFTRPGEVIDDPEKPGLKRAITHPLDEDFARQFEFRRCHIRDWSAPGQPPLNFRTMGFESISLAQGESLAGSDLSGADVWGLDLSRKNL